MSTSAAVTSASYNYVMTAAMPVEEDNGSGTPTVIPYMASGTSPDNSMNLTKYLVPSVNTYSYNGDYKVITADIDLTQCYRSSSKSFDGLSSTIITPTSEMYDIVMFFINGDASATRTLYVDSFTVELIEEK